MKTYVKAQVVAKNNPEGSYAAGCPSKERWETRGGISYPNCINCERTK